MTDLPQDDDIIATVRAAGARRLFGIATLYGLGALLIYLELTAPPASLWWQLFLVAMGGAAMVLGETMRRATAHSIILTRMGLFSTTGQALAPLADIIRVERGVFALKPSNGFTVVMTVRHGRGWAPGLWWRLGRRFAVGGVVPAGQTKFMAEALASLVIQRDMAETPE